ncbi:phosphopentomutase [Bacillus sp. N1-1]|uniref:phosphopentomutase n=1 Tax=Bacillus sp. N1-1 TaxID=2682541 RepID=UPI001318FEAB|nr:phosphopentomutase [Bacillus sp. N1-1]QHA93506.1 phosphopentomutase [Bacillus sp. N1-1]
MGRMVVLILDSFGIGAMDDCDEYEPGDCVANTYEHIRKKVLLDIPTMYSLGLNQLVDETGTPKGAYGKARLAHYGADTYMGHQEIVGSLPKRPTKRLMKDVHGEIATTLLSENFKVAYPYEDLPVLLIDDAIIVADNIESTPGNIINVTADLTKVSFEYALKVGSVVREVVDTSRVITLGGPHTSVERLLAVIKKGEKGQWGIDSPKAGVYGRDYHVRHMGYGVNVQKQFQTLAESKIPVYRIGKTADVLEGKHLAYSIVNTTEVLQQLKEAFSKEKHGAFLVNVQETDLAGHAENTNWYASLLEEVDNWLEEFIPLLNEDDILIVTADHGNDPTIGHSKHTREYTPLMITGPKVKAVSIGTRNTMADIGATLSDYFHIESTEAGTSFLNQILEG